MSACVAVEIRRESVDKPKVEQKVWEKTMAGETKQRVSNVKKLARAKAEQEEMDKRDLTRRKKEIAEREYEEIQAKKALAKNVRNWERSHSAYLRTINPYATKHNDDMINTIRESQRVGKSGALPFVKGAKR